MIQIFDFAYKKNDGDIMGYEKWRKVSDALSQSPGKTSL